MDSPVTNSEVSSSNIKSEENGSSNSDLPQTVTVLTTKDGNKVYLVGTAHFSLESQEDVAKVIQMVRPNIVMVELCSSRASILEMTEEKLTEEVTNLNYAKMKTLMEDHGTVQGLLYVLLMRMSKMVTQNLGMAPGGEFRRAFKEAAKLPGCEIFFGDRPLSITIKRALSLLSWYNLIRLSLHLLFCDIDVSQEEVEKYKNKEVLDVLLEEFYVKYPEIGQAFVKERDIFLTYSLQYASSRAVHSADGSVAPARVVGIVGIGHVAGIVKLWGTVSEKDIIPILHVPPPSRSTKILKFTIKISVAGIVIYGCSKLFPSVFKVWKFVNIPIKKPFS